MENKLEYKYLLHTWGGFYNDEHKKKHKQEEGYHYFNTKESRDEYLSKLEKISETLNAKMLMRTLEEGFHLMENTILHRVCRFDNKEYYTTKQLDPGFEYEIALFILNNKWYPGHNDYPLGEDFDYDNNQVEIVQEWVTGSFDIKQ